MITKFSRSRTKSNPWFTPALRALRTTLCRAEIVWKRTYTALSWSSFTSLRNCYHKLILADNLVTSSSSILVISGTPSTTVLGMIHLKCIMILILIHFLKSIVILIQLQSIMIHLILSDPLVSTFKCRPITFQ